MRRGILKSIGLVATIVPVLVLTSVPGHAATPAEASVSSTQPSDPSQLQTINIGNRIWICEQAWLPDYFC